MKAREVRKEATKELKELLKEQIEKYGEAMFTETVAGEMMAIIYRMKMKRDGTF